MAKTVATLAVASLLVLGLHHSGSAQTTDASKFEYQSSCAPCHGEDGKGKGPLSAELKTSPPDLTVLAKKNNGVFPISKVYQVIDGREIVIAHGTREMPIWGTRYMPDLNMAASPNAPDMFANPRYDPERIVRLRILAVIDYLSRIQEK